MRNVAKFGIFGLLVLGLSVLSSAAQAEKTASTDEQIAVLLKWYHNYLEEGKYKQAEQVARLAAELAPQDARVAAALKLAHRQQGSANANAAVDAQLEFALQRIERIERQLRDAAAKNRRRTIMQIAVEPPGSPDAR